MALSSEISWRASAPQQLCACGAPLQDGKGLLARLLMLDRWFSVTHIPKHCAALACATRNKNKWLNITVDIVSGKKETHWYWSCSSELQYFFVSPELSCSTAWLRQFHARQRFQHASSRGEADVFQVAALRDGDPVPKDARTAIQRTTSLERIHRGALKQPFSIARSPVEMVADVLPWYRAMMLQQRVAAARAASGDGGVKTVVMDGNQKITRRICGCPCAEVLDSEELGLSIEVKYGNCPAWKKSTCANHVHMAEGSPVAVSSIVGFRLLPAGSARSHLNRNGPLPTNASCTDNPWRPAPRPAATLMSPPNELTIAGPKRHPKPVQSPSVHDAYNFAECSSPASAKSWSWTMTLLLRVWASLMFKTTIASGE